MTFPIIHKTKSDQLSLSWFDDCLNNFDQLLIMPLPLRSAIQENEPKGMDILAWYSPWCKHIEFTYGIHLLDVGVVRFANSLLTVLKNPSWISRATALLWAAHCLNSHELCHGWIEQMIGYLEQGTDSIGKYAKRYQAGIYVDEEEAICNTAVYGAQHDFLLNVEVCPDGASENMKAAYVELESCGKKYHQTMLAALSTVMKNQPPGYKDFSPIDAHPSKHPLFIAKVHKLLSEKYQCQKDEINKALQLFSDSMHFAPVPVHFCKTPSWVYQPNLNSPWKTISSLEPICKKYDNDYYVSGITSKNGDIDLRGVCEDFEKLTDLNLEGKTINLFIDASQIENLSSIHKPIRNFSGNMILINPSRLNSRLLGLLQLEKLKQVDLVGDFSDALEETLKIINKYLKKDHDKRDHDLLGCKEELINAGYGSFAKL
jgi:hypothetical protein